MVRTMLRDVRRGESVDAVFLLESANFKQARNGKPFIQMVLRDRSASMKALRWEANREEFRLLERLPFIHISGRVEEYQGTLQIIIDELNSLSEEDARVNPSDFLPQSKYPLEEMKKRLDAVVRGIEDAPLRKLVEAVLARPGVREGLYRAPAGKAMHHAYLGGLLEHVLSLADLSHLVLGHYRWLDGSMLMAVVLLHDIGKVAELTYHVGFGYTDEGQLVGHIPIAVAWIDEAASGIPELAAERVTELKHLVASHHGKLEFGSPKVPMTGEALALHFLDNLDAKLAAYLQSYEDTALDPQGDRWGDFHTMLGARIYFPRGLDARLGRTPAPAAPAPSAPAKRPAPQSKGKDELPFGG